MIRSLSGARILWAGCLLSAAFLIGCGGGGTGKVSVRGTVTYKGDKVGAGTVKFYNQKKEQVSSAMLKDDGSFVATDIPREKITVTVESSAAGTVGKLTTGKAPTKTVVEGSTAAGKGVDVPAKYRSADTSDLKFDITQADQSLDVKLQ